MKKGVVLISALVFTSVFLILVGSIMRFTSRGYFTANRIYRQNQALYLAEAGIDWAIYKINQDSSFFVEGSPNYYQFFGEGQGQAKITVSAPSTNKKEIKVEAYLPEEGNALFKKTLKVTIKTETGEEAKFVYAIHVGDSGLKIGTPESPDNITIAGSGGTAGNIYSNGPVKILKEAGDTITITGGVAAAGFKHKRVITITNNTGGVLSDYQVLVDFTGQVLTDSDGNDIRFYQNGNLLQNYWQESWSTNTGKFWIKIPSIPQGDSEIIAYYGKKGLSSASNFGNTFTKEDGPGLVGLWHMDEGSGESVADSSGNGNNGKGRPMAPNITPCDDLANWTGNFLTLDTDDKKEGTASVKDTISSPSVGINYDTTYRGLWNLQGYNDLVFWIRSDRPGSSFNLINVIICDTSGICNTLPASGNALEDIKGYIPADKWRRVPVTITKKAGIDLTNISKLIFRFQAKDNISFYKKIDWIGGDKPEWQDKDGGKGDGWDMDSSKEDYFRGSHLKFDGVDDYVNIPDSPSLQNIQFITIEAWVKPDIPLESERGRIVYKDNAYDLEIWKDGKFGTVSKYKNKAVTDPPSLGYFSLVSDNPLPSGWSHIAYTFDGTNIRLYLNGELNKSALIAEDTIASSTYPVGIGGGAGYPILEQYYKGFIDEVRIYNRALTAAEIKAHYERRKFASPDPSKSIGPEANSQGEIYCNESLICGQTSGECGITEVTNCQVERKAFPTFNIDFWKDEAAKGGTLSGGTVSSGSLGPKKIEGDLTISGPVEIRGPVWVTGNFTLESNALVSLWEEFKQDGTLIIVDGKIEAKGGASVNKTTEGGYLLFLSTYSNLNYDDQKNAAITLTGGNLYAAFLVPWGWASLGGNTNLTSITSEYLEIQGGAEIIYEEGLGTILFSTGPTAAWKIIKGTWQES